MRRPRPISLTLDFDLSRPSDFDAFVQIVKLYESVGSVRVSGMHSLMTADRLAMERQMRVAPLPASTVSPRTQASYRLAIHTVAVCEKHGWDINLSSQELAMTRHALRDRLSKYVMRGWLNKDGALWHRMAVFPRPEMAGGKE